MATKILQTHDLPDLPVRPRGDPKKLTVITTSDFDLKGKLKDAARRRIEGADEGVVKMTTVADVKRTK